MEMDFMDRVEPVIDETIKSLARKKFIEDPIAGNRHSRNTSIISSAYKRHGRILETALRESLRDSNRHRVWKEDVFKVSRAADQLVNLQSDATARSSSSNRSPLYQRSYSITGRVPSRSPGRS